MGMQTPRGSRRDFLLVAGGTAISGIAGCLGEDTTASPVAIPDDHSCSVCNMIVHNHPGPSGHARYPDSAAVYGVQDGIVPFCSSVCAYDYYFEMAEEGVTPYAFFLTDYSTVDWTVEGQSGMKFISAHFVADAQTDVSEMAFVVDSAVLGAMGESAIGFSNETDAVAFSREYGGDIYGHSEITRELIESLGFAR